MNPETKASAPKKSNVGLIIAIIAAALVIAGGAVATILILINANSGADNNSGASNLSVEEEKKVSEPYKNDSAYYIKIDGKKYGYKSQLSDLKEAGYEVYSAVKNKTVPAGKYMIMIGGGSLSNSEKGTSFSITPYNDGSDDVTFPEAKLGKVTVSKSTIAKAQAEYEAMEFFGGLHLGSTREELIEIFGEPTETHEYTNYKNEPYEKIEYQDKTWKEFEFQIEDGKITEISWTNYGGLNH